MQDLTIETPEGPLSTGTQNTINGQLGFYAITAQYIADNEHINAIVDNVEFISNGWVMNGLLVESGFNNPDPGTVPLADIDISITNCSFSGSFWWGYGALLQEIREGNVVVGAKGKGNVFNNCDLGIWHCVSLNTVVYGNKFIGQGRWFALQIVNGTYYTQIPHSQVSQSVCNVEKNTFQVLASTGAILINDNRRTQYEDEIPMLLQFKNNKIHTEECMTGGGYLNLSNAVIRNNNFTGTAEYGLRIFPQVAEIYSDNGLMLGNNFSNAEYSLTTVLLGEGTSNWTITGGNLGESIADYGENNLISGFNNNTSDVPFGQTIADNLKVIKGPMHNLKGN